MTHIELYITINQTGHSYKCDVLEYAWFWRAVMYQEDFEYTTIQASTVWKCLEALADNIHALGELDSIEGDDSGVYAAIIQGHLLRLKANGEPGQQTA